MATLIQEAKLYMIKRW